MAATATSPHGICFSNDYRLRLYIILFRNYRVMRLLDITISYFQYQELKIFCCYSFYYVNNLLFFLLV